MSRVRVAVPAVINASAEEVYAVLSDYINGHPHILPRDHFRDLIVEEGGRGAGTVFRLVTMSAGIERTYRMTVTEPEPGRVLMESDTASSMVTTFTMTPEADAGRCVLEIATAWDASPGLSGLFERLAYPPAMRRIYHKELRQLEKFLLDCRHV